MAETRTCTGCGETFPATLEFFHVHKRGKGGLRPKCKKCRSERRRLRYSNPSTKKRSLELSKLWDSKNPENRKSYVKKYKSSKKAKERRSEYRRERYYGDENYRLRKVLSSRFYNWFKCKDTKKHCSFSDIVDFTPEELWDHLESKFEEGMTRDNHGEWHIDHIVPLDRFDPSCWMQMSVAWELDNLQPLWATDNISKGTKLNWSKG